ncbi:uncharacterized protein H6S33_012696 [Morchella sextelata]|uniref:uncharacterized protein n=1 Tax=Morchella sextelata TaxID=1174677 RepID=UPI001D04EF68|nr:uncharacterized protein H6S33_012696 [Morchella sextelata]KAH0610150.1 hypothetical protein H6S33_012696 [Morchella sextelata]
MQWAHLPAPGPAPSTNVPATPATSSKLNTHATINNLSTRYQQQAQHQHNNLSTRYQQQAQHLSPAQQTQH